MRFDPPLVPATLVRREKRFLVHLLLEDGTPVIAHTNNTGSMMGCDAPGSRAWISPADSPHRKLKWTYEMVEAGDVRVGINTARAQRLTEEALAEGRVGELAGHESMKREQVSSPGSRMDLLLEGGAGRTWVEVKNVTLVDGQRALFPDAVSARGLKHLRELERLAAAGDRAFMFYVVQRGDAESFAPAESIDPAYAEGLRHAAAHGVGVLAWRALVTPEEIRLERPLPVLL